MKQTEVDAEPLFAEAAALLDTRLAALNEMRASEGERIEEMLESRCADIESIAASVREPHARGSGCVARETERAHREARRRSGSRAA